MRRHSQFLNYTMIALFVLTVFWFGGAMWATWHSGRAAQILHVNPDLPRTRPAADEAAR